MMASDDLRHKANGTRLSRLLVDKGTEAMRQIFDWFHPPATLAAVLKAKVSQLQGLRYRVITSPQWDLLYPASGNPNSKTFDVSLLTILFRNICVLSAPATGWDTLPPGADRTIAANIVRIKHFRNKVYGHVTTTGVDNVKFEDLWQKISSALTDLNIPQSEIGDLKSCPLSPEEESYVQQLKEWKSSEEKCLEVLDELTRIGNDTQHQIKRFKDDVLEKTDAIQDSLTKLTRESNEKSSFNDEILTKLAKYSFDGEIQNSLKTYHQGTREWLFGRVDDWFADKESRVFILTAGPGVGKSFFAGKLCQVYGDEDKLAACHFCKFNDSDLSNPRRMLESLASHMCDNVQGFKMKLIDQLKRPHNVSVVRDAFRLYLSQPLQNLKRSLPMLIVIDGLDESAAYGKNDLLDLIAEEFSKLPEWVKILVTSRPEIPVKKKLSHLNLVEILPGDKQNDADIQQYFENSLPGLASEVEIIALLVKRCEGSFLFAYYTTTHLSKSNDISTVDLKEIEVLFPQGIGSVYEKYFRRLEKELKDVDERLDVFPMLEILVAALGPLPLKFISEVFEFPSIDSRSLREIVAKVNDCLSTLLFVSDGCVTVFHKSLVDWLTSDDYDKHRYTVERGRGNEKLWLLCKREFETIKANNSRDLKMTAEAKYSLCYGSAQLKNVDREIRRESDYEWLVDMEIYYLQLVHGGWKSTRDPGHWDIVVRVKLRMKQTWLDSKCVVIGTEYLQNVVNESCGLFTGEEKQSARRLLGKDEWCEELRAPGQQERNFVSTLNAFSSEISCVGVLREKHLFAAGFEDGTVCVLDQELRIVCKFHATNKRRVPCCVFCPSRRVLLCGDLNSCFNIDTGEKSSFFLSYDEKYTTCSFSPSGNSLLTADGSEVIKVWDVEKKTLLRKITSDHKVNSCQYSESGRFIIACSLNVNVVFDHWNSHVSRSTIWSASTFERVAQRDVTSLVFDDIKLPDSLRDSVEEGDLHTEEGVEKNRKGFHYNVCFDVQGTEFFLCANGQELDVYLLPMPFPVARLVDRDCSFSRYLQNTSSCSVLQCSPHSWNKLADLRSIDHCDDVLCDYIVDSTWNGEDEHRDQLSLVSESQGLYARYKELFLVKLPRPNPSLSIHFRIVWCSFSADGLRLASCCDNGIVQIWDVYNGQVAESFSWPVCLGCYWSKRYFWTIQSVGCRLVISRLPVDECSSIKYDAEEKFFQETEVVELLTASEGVFVFKRKDGFASFISVTEDGKCSPAKTLPGIRPAVCAAVSPGGCSILTCGYNQYEIWAGDGNIQCHSLMLPEADGPEYFIRCSITSNGEKGVIVVTGCVGHCWMFVFDLRSGDEFSHYPSLYSQHATGVGCVGTQSHVAIRENDSDIGIWDLTTIEAVAYWKRMYQLQEAPVLAYAPKQNILAIPVIAGKIVFLRIHFPK